MNKKIISLFAFLILFIAACTTGTKKSSTDIDVRVGFSGLTLEFLKNTPPQKVFEGDIVPVLLKVKNNGAYSIPENNKAVLSLGFEKDYTKSVKLLQGGRVQALDGLYNTAALNLEGKSPINQIGDEEVISYNLEAGKIDPQSEAHTSTVVATLCYPYETVLSSTVCIDTDINNLRPAKKVCSNKYLIFSNGQGAPVAVTKLEINMLPTISEKNAADKIKPQFLIYVENKGQGTVIKNEAVKDFCTKSDTSHENLNIVYVDAELSGKKLKCQLEKKKDSNELGHIKLKDKKDIIRCSTVNAEESNKADYMSDIDRNQDPYLSPLKISLNYGYTQSISANYFIQKPVS